MGYLDNFQTMTNKMKQGQHPHKALSVAKIRQLIKPGKYADGDGLYLVISKSGTRKWIWRAVISGKRRELGVGGHSTSLAEARDAAQELSLNHRRGHDILDQRRKMKRSIPNFKDAAILVHAHHKDSWKNPKHSAQWINTLTTYAFPIFGSVGVDQVDTDHILRALAPIWHEKPETAKRVRQRIGKVLDWAKAKKYRVGENPINLVSVDNRVLAKQPQEPKHLAALPYSDIPIFMEELRQFSQSSEIIRLALEFTILNAVRTGEVRLSRRDELANGIWTIPAEKMKANKEHRVPLSKRSLEIVDRAIEISGNNDLLFPNPRSGRPLSENSLLQLVKNMGKKGQFTVHGFRSSFRDWCAEKTNFPAEVAEAALAHSIRNKVEAAYRRTDHLEQRRLLMNSWDSHCCRSSEVLPFKTNKAIPA